MPLLTNLIRKIVQFFHSGQAEAALNRAAELVPKALPIVRELAILAPNRTDQEIAAAYEKYAVPMAGSILATPTSERGYVLLQLATQILAAEVPGTATYILNAAVQLAVTGSKA
ncbi:MAG TPA: hypothetical protein VN736_09635 [Candidatus Limnocylindrales bacterium]|nr:hypothetical protein [Candidatus Limnocylindrales bacterium]